MVLSGVPDAYEAILSAAHQYRLSGVMGHGRNAFVMRVEIRRIVEQFGVKDANASIAAGHGQ